MNQKRLDRIAQKLGRRHKKRALPSVEQMAAEMAANIEAAMAGEPIEAPANGSYTGEEHRRSLVAFCDAITGGYIK